MSKVDLNSRKRVQISFKDSEKLTKSYFKDECDINNIVTKFQETGMLPSSRGEPQFGYVPDLDFKTALDLVKSARADFDSLDDDIRQMFGFSESNYFDFLENTQGWNESDFESYFENLDPNNQPEKGDDLGENAPARSSKTKSSAGPENSGSES